MTSRYDCGTASVKYNPNIPPTLCAQNAIPAPRAASVSLSHSERVVAVS
jgi:hypothetical protein